MAEMKVLWKATDMFYEELKQYFEFINKDLGDIDNFALNLKDSNINIKFDNLWINDNNPKIDYKEKTNSNEELPPKIGPIEWNYSILSDFLWEEWDFFDEDWYADDWFKPIVIWQYEWDYLFADVDRQWYNRKWYHRKTWYDREWFNQRWFNQKRIHKKTWTKYNEFWFDASWLHKETWTFYDENWYDIDWFDLHGYDKNWYNQWWRKEW